MSDEQADPFYDLRRIRARITTLTLAANLPPSVWGELCRLDTEMSEALVVLHKLLSERRELVALCEQLRAARNEACELCLGSFGMGERMPIGLAAKLRERMHELLSVAADSALASRIAPNQDGEK